MKAISKGLLVVVVVGGCVDSLLNGHSGETGKKKKGIVGLQAELFMQIGMPHILLKCDLKSVSEQGVKGLTSFSSLSRY